MRTKTIWQIGIILFVLLFGAAAGAYVYRSWRVHKQDALNARRILPDSLTVKIDSTNLPIVFVNTQGHDIERDKYVTAYVKMIDNGTGMNFGDTIEHVRQQVNFEGCMEIKYRGFTSYWGANKRSYTIRAVDMQKGGKAKKSKLLGMRKGKKWALRAGYYDRSMIRDALTFELARPYMDFVPQTRFCEMVIDGVYHGIYCLSELVTADRLKLEKPGDDEVGVSGGYLLEIDNHHKNAALYLSKYWDFCVLPEYPDADKLSSVQQSYVRVYLQRIEHALQTNDSSVFACDIDMLSMVDYQLASEFSHNGDAYVFSTFMYKHRDDKGARLRFSLWDFDLGYGNYAMKGTSDTDTWMYEKKGYWWREAMKIPTYADCVKKRWKQYRNEAYSDEHVVQVVDSLANVLTAGGAEQRNTVAWDWWNFKWNSDTRPQKYMSSSYEDEINYLKEWISRRLQWMDAVLLDE